MIYVAKKNVCVRMVRVFIVAGISAKVCCWYCYCLAYYSRSPAGYTRDALILLVRSLLKALRHALEILPHYVTNSPAVPVFDFTGSKMRIFSFWIENINHNCGIFNNTPSTPDDDAAEQSSCAQYSLYERMLW